MYQKDKDKEKDKEKDKDKDFWCNYTSGAAPRIQAQLSEKKRQTYQKDLVL